MELSNAELEDNIDELMRIVHDRFIFGKDAMYFDYATVDDNECSINIGNMTISK